MTELVARWLAAVCLFASATAFLDAYDNEPGVLLLDLRMPGMSCLELQTELVEKNVTGLSVLLMSGYSDIPIAVEVIKRGAADFLQKPFRDQDFLDSVHSTLAENRLGLEQSHEAREIQKRLDTLTPRESQVMDMVADGKANKVIAQDLNVSQRTVELHRAHVMEKMGVRSLAHLVRTLDRIKYTNKV